MQGTILIEVCNKELEARVEFGYIPAIPARLLGLPENCYPAEPEEWDINELLLKDKKGNFCVDVSELIDYIREDIIEALRELLIEEAEEAEC